MRKQADVNVIITEEGEPLPTIFVMDYEADLCEFYHLTLLEEGFPLDVDTISMTAIINTLYRIGAMQDSTELHRTVEVLALLHWSKEQVTQFHQAGDSMYDVLPSIPQHGDPLVVTLLLIVDFSLVFLLTRALL